jgi:hypothetical protein
MKINNFIKPIQKPACIIMMTGSTWEDADEDSNFADDFEEESFEEKFSEDDNDFNVKYRRHNELFQDDNVLNNSTEKNNSISGAIQNANYSEDKNSRYNYLANNLENTSQPKDLKTININRSSSKIPDSEKIDSKRDRRKIRDGSKGN